MLSLNASTPQRNKIDLFTVHEEYQCFPSLPGSSHLFGLLSLFFFFFTPSSGGHSDSKLVVSLHTKQTKKDEDLNTGQEADGKREKGSY